MKTFTVSTKSGKTYNARLLDIKISDRPNYVDNTHGGDQFAEIEVDGVWYECMASRANDANTKTVAINQFSTELRNALNVPSNIKTKVHIKANVDWHILYNDMLKESEVKWEEESSKASFSKISFTHHSMRKYCDFNWDSELSHYYIEYNKTVKELKAALKFIDPNSLKEYLVNSDYDDYNCWTKYEIQVSDLDKIITLSKPGLEKYKENKLKSEEAEKKYQEKKVNIAAGCIYFHCESAPHNEDLSNAILNRPCPNNGIFTIEHRINETLFNRIKKYGNYWDAEWLEECDMFTSSPGWRFSIEAVKELAETNKVYVDNVLYNKL